MIKLTKSTFYNETKTKKKLVDFIKRAPILSMGEECRAFEKEFAAKQGRKYALFVNSGSSANLILIQALLNLGHLKKNDSVAFSALTWPTGVMPLIQLGLHPVPLDCELDTLNVSLRKLKALSVKPKCFFITNVLGFCDDLPEIRDYCARKKLILIEDNCESLGSKISGTLLGNFGVASTFSFFVGHHLSTIEGGMIATDDQKLFEMLSLVRAHGWERNLGKDAAGVLRKKWGIDDFHARYTFYDLAYNVRPTDIQGFLGRTQLPYWDTIVRTREGQYQHLAEIIAGNEDFFPLRTDHMEIVSNFAVPVICKDHKTFERYRKKFEDAGVEIRPVIAGNMARQPFYTKYVSGKAPCPNADMVHTNGFYFGNSPEMTEKELKTLSRLLEREV